MNNFNDVHGKPHYGTCSTDFNDNSSCPMGNDKFWFDRKVKCLGEDDLFHLAKLEWNLKKAELRRKKRVREM